MSVPPTCGPRLALQGYVGTEDGGRNFHAVSVTSKMLSHRRLGSSAIDILVLSTLAPPAPLRPRTPTPRVQPIRVLPLKNTSHKRRWQKNNAQNLWKYCDSAARTHDLHSDSHCPLPLDQLIHDSAVTWSALIQYSHVTWSVTLICGRKTREKGCKPLRRFGSHFPVEY